MTARQKIALVGVGKIALDQHLPALTASTDWDLAATYSLAGRVAGIPAYDNFATLLAERPDIGTVTFCLPPGPRHDLAAAALQAGRHVMLEKPPGATLAEVHKLQALARRRDLALFASWHSRMAAGVAPARTWLQGRRVTGGRITWHEDLRRWHPGQDWILQPGGMGVFDPGINALSILTEILPEPVHLIAATLQVPANRDMPIAAQLAFSGGISADLDWRCEGQQIWQIRIETDAGVLVLDQGGAALQIDGHRVTPDPCHRDEYPALYARLAELVTRQEQEVDLAPMVLVADALALGRREAVRAFHF